MPKLGIDIITLFGDEITPLVTVLQAGSQYEGSMVLEYYPADAATNYPLVSLCLLIRVRCVACHRF